jgi:hypothetical protein
MVMTVALASSVRIEASASTAFPAFIAALACAISFFCAVAEANVANTSNVTKNSFLNILSRLQSTACPTL